jgi:hypothetical protein
VGGYIQILTIHDKLGRREYESSPIYSTEPIISSIYIELKEAQGRPISSHRTDRQMPISRHGEKTYRIVRIRDTFLASP